MFGQEVRTFRNLDTIKGARRIETEQNVRRWVSRARSGRSTARRPAAPRCPAPRGRQWSCRSSTSWARCARRPDCRNVQSRGFFFPRDVSRSLKKKKPGISSRILGFICKIESRDSWFTWISRNSGKFSEIWPKPESRDLTTLRWILQRSPKILKYCNSGTLS